MTQEVWKPIPGYDGKYEASDLGRIRSVDRLARAVSKSGKEYFRLARGRVLRPGLCRGYPIVNPHPYGTVAVHLLVARTFVPQTAVEVNHKDGVKTNCSVSNLEWVSKRENQLHAVRMGLKKQARPVVAPSGKAYPSIRQAAKAEKVRVSTAAKWAAI